MATQYQVVTVNGGVAGTETRDWAPFLRQLHISSGVWTLYFMSGLCAGAPTVFIPQMRNQTNSTNVINEEIVSWFYTLSSISAIPWIFVAPMFAQRVGRKVPYLATCIAMSTYNVFMYFSLEPYHIFIAQAIQGFANAINTSVVILIIPEYCSPYYRNIFLSIQSTSFHWGVWVSNAIGSFFNWRYIAIAGVISSLYALSVAFFPESPHWLASKGKFKESRTGFRWLRGVNRESEKELRDLIEFYAISNAQEHEDKKKIWLTVMETIKCKQFYMPLLLSIFLGAQYNLSGKYVCSVYIIDIIKNITGTEHAAYIDMLILDGVTIFGMYMGLIFYKMLKSRTLYLRLAFLSIVIMFSISLYLYLAKHRIIQENNVVLLCLLLAYSLSISCGPAVICLAIYCEIMPMRYQSVSHVITSFAFISLCAGMIKLSPILFKDLGIHGSFLFFGISSGIFTCLLYIYLPETKGKTLMEIEQFFQDKIVSTEAQALTR